MVTISFPDGVAWRLQERWRGKLAETQSRYAADQTEKNRAEYLNTLKTFADLVVRSKIPQEGWTES
jgi:hypothetical protein